jgi:hypothetical protein
VVKAVSAGAQFLSEREITAPSIDALFNAARRTGGLRESAARWAGRDRLPGRPNDRLHYYFRGQTDASWTLSSTLYRAVQGVGRVTEAKLAKAEAAVIREMRHQGLGHRMSDGELLMVLQHHEIPTRLIDFCRSPLPALYFATEEMDGTDGRLFIVGQRIDNNDKYPTISLGRRNGALPWAGAAIGDTYSAREWSDTVACVDDDPLDPRMRAQNGCFLVGGLIKRYGGENLSIGGVVQPVAVWPEISTLRIFFPLRGAKRPTADRWPAVGWTVRIPADWKSELRSRLADRDYTRDHVYPDYDGCRRLGSYVAAEAVR